MGIIHSVLIEWKSTEIHHSFKGVHVDNLVVDENFRSLGIGKTLLKAARSWATAEGASELHTKVYDFNTDAVQFYEANGFTPLNRIYRMKL